ncbi:sensor histidine kinase [Tundrisphaera sp. TA3]|uniref:sensor histidine kinase n=1 Tax=Tundrisphaera sp. TA3 TaxID=3435775 RepID=UPI003EBEE9DB
MDEKKAEELSHSLNELGHLSSGIGHHVINALSAIVSNAEILRLNNPSATDPTKQADIIIQTAVDAASVARRLIDFTRPITGIGEEKLAFDRLITEYVEDRRSKGPEGVTWQAEIVPPVPPIRGHAGHLRAMLDLLVENATEAMIDGATTITFRMSVDPRGWVTLEVADTGKGMTPEDLERAVEPFYSTKSGHLGVGLSVANGIWRRHRGTLSLRSQPGAGTTLRLCVEPSIN